MSIQHSNFFVHKVFMIGKTCKNAPNFQYSLHTKCNRFLYPSKDSNLSKMLFCFRLHYLHEFCILIIASICECEAAHDIFQ